MDYKTKMMEIPSEEIVNFGDAAEWLQNTLDEWGQWEAIAPREQKVICVMVTRANALLEDIGLTPDRKYSVVEIDRLKLAIEWALDGQS